MSNKRIVHKLSTSKSRDIKKSTLVMFPIKKFRINLCMVKGIKSEYIWHCTGKDCHNVVL